MLGLQRCSSSLITIAPSPKCPAPEEWLEKAQVRCTKEPNPESLLRVKLPSQSITFRIKSTGGRAKVREAQGWLVVFWLERGGDGGGIYEDRRRGFRAGWLCDQAGI